MNPMSGPEEAAQATALIVDWVTVGAAVTCAGMSLWFKSRRSAWISLIMVALALALVEPWTELISSLPADPIAAYWEKKFQLVSIAVMVVSGLCVASVINARRFGRPADAALRG